MLAVVGIYRKAPTLQLLLLPRHSKLSMTLAYEKSLPC